MAYIRGVDRNEVLLFPECVEDYITEDNPVRFVDAIAESLDLVELGFVRATPADTGRPSYDPADMMKQRQRIVEHPFGTIKRAMNQGYFLTRGLKKVGAEMSLTVLSYNIKRAINIIGVKKMIEAVT